MPIVDRGRIAGALPGRVLGRELGSGAFGLVLAARQRDPDRDVAVKVIDLGAAPAVLPTPGGDHPLVAVSHPHLAETHAVLTVDRLLLLVTELLPGGSLERQNLSPQAACAVALATADALARAHAAGVLHRDVKPANILFTADGLPKLTDLGVAGLAEDAELTAGRIVGTPQYMAPEQVTGDPLGPPTDVYALAATLYELLAGAPLFGAGLTPQDLFRRHCEVPAPPAPGVPEPVSAVLARALSKNPAERQPGAAAFAVDLADAARLSYGPGWTRTAAVPLHIDPLLLDRALSPAGTSVAPAAPAAAPGGDPGATVRLPPGSGAAPPPGQPAPAATARGVTRPLVPTPNPTPVPVPAVPAGAPGGPPPTPAPAGRHRRGRPWRVIVPVVAVVVLAVVATVLAVTASGGGSETPAAAGTPAPTGTVGLGPTAPPSVEPTAGAPAVPPKPAAYRVVPIAGTGAEGFSGDGGPATRAMLDKPYAPALDAAGNLYIPDFANNRVRKVSPDGTITTVAGTGQAGFSGDGGPATAAMLNQPAAVAVGPGGTLYIADTFNHRIRQVAPNGTIRTIAGTDDRGYDDEDSGRPATQVTLYYPAGIAVDATGNLYIADNANDFIRKIGVNGILTDVAGHLGYGGWGDGHPALDAMVSKPFAVAVDRKGQIYIADSNNHRVRKIGLNGVITTIAGTGVPGFSGDGGPATSARLSYPRGVAVDNAGNVYVTDVDNRRIRRIDPSGVITTVAGTGVGADARPAPPDAISPDGSVAVDSAGRLYVADRARHRIVRIDKA